MARVANMRAALLARLLARSGCPGCTPSPKSTRLTALHCILEKPAYAVALGEAEEDTRGACCPGWANQRSFRLDDLAATSIEAALDRGQTQFAAECHAQLAQ